MVQHYRHYRVASRDKKPNSDCMLDCFTDTLSKQPLLTLGLIFLSICLLMKCLFCHK